MRIVIMRFSRSQMRPASWCVVRRCNNGGKSIFGRIEKHEKRIYFWVVKYAYSQPKEH